MITITLNGTPYPLSKEQTVADLVEQLGFKGQRIAVEYNGEIVPHSQHPHTTITPDARIEIVRAVGGG